MFNAPTFNSITFNSADTKKQVSIGDFGVVAEAVDKPFFDVFELGLGNDLAAQSQGTVVTAATSTNVGSTRTPATRGVLLALTTGDIVLIYQAGTEGSNGLMYRTSPNRGVTWGSETQISSKEDVYPSAVVQRDTNDIHLIYSRDEASPTLDASSSIWYRRMKNIGVPGIPAFEIGSELTMALGSGSVAYERASINIDSSNVPYFSGVRHTATGTTVICGIGAVAGNLAGAAMDTSVVGINIVSPDISLAAATLGTSWFVGVQSGGTFWLTRATGPNVGLSTIEFTSVASWSVDEVHTIAVSGGAGGRYVYIAYLLNDFVYVVKWDNLLETLGTPVQVGGGAVRVALAVDEAYGWVFFIQHVGTRTLLVFGTEEESWATAVVTQTTTATEDWDWPNTVARIDDAQAAVVAWCSITKGSEDPVAAENIYVSSNNIEIPKAAFEIPLATETVNNRRGVDELSTVQDVLGVGQVVGENVVYTEDSTAQGTPKVIEEVLALEEYTKVTEVLEEILATEDLNNSPLLDEEILTALDEAAQKNQVVAVESRTVTDAVFLNLQPQEVALFDDAVSSLIRTVSETGSGIEELVNDRPVGDSGAGADALSFIIQAFETPTAVFLISRVIELLEHPIGSDIISNFDRPVGESGTATDVAKWEYILYEVAEANDISVQEARAVATTLRLLVTKSAIRLRTEGW